MELPLPSVPETIGKLPSQSFPHLTTLGREHERFEQRNLATSGDVGCYPFEVGQSVCRNCLYASAFPTKVIHGNNGTPCTTRSLGRISDSDWLKAAGYIVSETSTAHSVSKAAVVAMTKALAYELAPHKIRVNGIAPGYIYSEMTNEFLASDAGKDAVKRVPQKRVGQPSDLDGTPLLLASQRASGFMTGITVTEGSDR